MSRRSRRRKAAGGRDGWFGRIVIVLVVAGVLLLGGGYLMLRNYLHSEGFRKFLSSTVSRAADVSGDFSRFRWDGLAVDTDSFEATGDGPLVRLKADQLHTEIGFGGVRRGVWELKGTSVRRLDAEIVAGQDHDENVPPEVKAPVTRGQRPKRWYPGEVELKGFDVREANIDATLKDGKTLSLKGISVHASSGQAKGSYSAEIGGGTLSPSDAFWPEIHIDRVKARFQDRVLFVTSAEAGVWDDGRLQAVGEWDTRAETYAFEGDVGGVGLEHLVRKNWAKRVTGKVSSDFTVEGRSGSTVARGSLKISDAVITALPVLDVLAAYADTQRFRELHLNEVHANWTWRREETTLTDLVLASDGLIRLQGNLALRGEDLEGDFLLGIAPGILAAIPGAETDVFVPGERGLLWTRVRMRGTIDDPKEDLSDRLIAAAGLRIFEELPGGEKVLKFSRSLLGEHPEETILKGIETFEDAEKAVRETRDVLKGIFGK